MVYIQQGQTPLKLFSKKLSILLKAIGDIIPDKFKIILIESKFKFDILQRVKEYDNFLQFRSEEVLSLIVNSIKSNSQKKKPQKCFKCLRVGHIPKIVFLKHQFWAENRK